MDKEQLNLDKLDNVSGGATYVYSVDFNSVSIIFSPEDIEHIQSNDFEYIANDIMEDFLKYKSLKLTMADKSKIIEFLSNNYSEIVNSQSGGLFINYQIAAEGSDVITDIQ